MIKVVSCFESELVPPLVEDWQMNRFANQVRLHLFAFETGMVALALLGLGCEEGTSAQQNTKRRSSSISAVEETAGSDADSSSKSDKTADPKKVEMGRNVTLEVQGEKRRVIVQAEVCLREGMLEH